MAEALLVFTLNETIVQAVARLVDDAGAIRVPSHSDLEDVFWRVGLAAAHLTSILQSGPANRSTCGTCSGRPWTTIKPRVPTRSPSCSEGQPATTSSRSSRYAS